IQCACRSKRLTALVGADDARQAASCSCARRAASDEYACAKDSTAVWDRSSVAETGRSHPNLALLFFVFLEFLRFCLPGRRITKVGSHLLSLRLEILDLRVEAFYLAQKLHCRI